ncbi:Hvo_1808 family surface protein [Halobacteria archaeon HArc-gm2]|nr:Hvo_1808 family surface protein [Halobacteria archaeon HArc-gm2]
MRLPRPTRRFLLLCCLAVLLALAGCQSGSDGGDGVTHVERPDPESDRLGWEDGYWHDDPVSINESDGYNESEIEAVAARTMARIEVIRDLEFEEDVSVELVSQAEHRERGTGNHSLSARHDAYHAQVWEAALILGEDTSPSEARQSVSSEAVAGYYDPSSGEIVVVGNETLDTATLAHELTHAVQDQQFDLSGDPAVRDSSRARTMVIEGDADAVESRYVDRCGHNWSCAGSVGEGLDFDAFVQLSELLVCEFLPDCENGPDIDQGYMLTFAQPYRIGPEFVEGVHDDGGWDAVNDLHGNYPASTEQVIHAEKYPDEKPVNVTVEDRSTDEWSRFDHEPVAQTLGESILYVTFYDNDALNGTRNYSRAPSAGWAGDALVPYHNGTVDANESSESETYGYVWKLEWDTEQDAREFDDAYRSILADRANASAGQDVYVLPESDPYGDAFRVSRDGTTVTIVNAPARSDLSEIHAPVEE